CNILLVGIVSTSVISIATFISIVGSKDAHINSIRVEQCDKEPCVVHKGADYTVQVNFTTTRDINEAHNVLHGGLGFLQVPFPLTPENACIKSVTCPMIAGNTYIYRQTMTCPSFAPSLKVTARWELKDEHGADIFCFATGLSIIS
ncbi:NPC intracellular cholesterol transporter 2-like, partial [Ruditapes philippinarum]|uniref:NPC intracellular cholesterol transporter 2-like n=1 Tax=Ruditapes philippinarum TaxID=129788 RepID=UPI00295BD1A6